jgi:hypothetical protein
MSKNKHLPEDGEAFVKGTAQPETPKTQQAAEKATTYAASVTAPETVVVDNPPPKPNYPLYRVQPGERISLADTDPNASEDYKKKKEVIGELEKHSGLTQLAQCERLNSTNALSTN